MKENKVKEDKSLFDIVSDICNPKNNTYYCDGCERDIPMLEVEWKNDTPICPKCESVIKL